MGVVADHRAIQDEGIAVKGGMKMPEAIEVGLP